LIFNLSGREYDYDKFDNRVIEFSFPDHHSPPLEILFKIVLTMNKFLNEKVGNTIIVHCLGGKGRTGTVIACYLVYAKIFKDVNLALEHFALKRSSTKKGVVQQCQLRYAQYFNSILQSKTKPDFRKTLFLDKIILTSVPLWSKKSNEKRSRPVVEIYSSHHYPKKLLFSSSSKGEINWLTKESGPIIWNIKIPIQSDILVVVCKYKGKEKKNKKIFQVGLHCAFIQTPIEKFKFEDFDAGAYKKKRNERLVFSWI